MSMEKFILTYMENISLYRGAEKDMSIQRLS